MFPRRIPALLLALVWTALPARAEGIKVVASVAPVHSLLAGVMDGVGEPALLVRGGRGPHSFVMKPSGARLLHGARVVFWIGPGLEGFLVKPLAGLPPKTQVVGLAADKGADPHIWLDPVKARKMAQTMARTLIAVDPANAANYQKNADRVVARLVLLEAELHRILAPVSGVSYLVFHDAYGHFQERFGLAARGAVALHADRPAGARRLSALRRRIVKLDIACVFTEPQFTPALAKTLIEGTKARLGVLDPLGADLKPGPGLYLALMRRLAEKLLECLGANG